MSRMLSSSCARVEKVDSPIGDENGSQVFVSIARTVSRESRFPDRGRKPNTGSLFTYSSRNVEKVDSPIGGENYTYGVFQNYTR